MSLPSRERGLKCILEKLKNYGSVMSLPSRERGLKFPNLIFLSTMAGRSLRGSVD